MNKPILVKNQSEWNRLAAVLEALGYVFPDNLKPTEFNPFLTANYTMNAEDGDCIIIYAKNNKPNIILWSFAVANPKNWGIDTDEYINQQQHIEELNKYKTLYEELLAKHEKPCDPQRLCCHNATQKLKGQLGESEALYETLLQGVKDAKTEMERRAIKANEIGNKERDNDAIFAAFGLNMALEILTDKTNVL